MTPFLEAVARAIRDELRRQAVLWEDDDQTERDEIMFLTGCSAYLPGICQAAIDVIHELEGWQDIATWPKTDEAYALVCRAGWKIPFVACYDAYGDGWYSFNGHYERNQKKPLVPTHWRPLHPPPLKEQDNATL